MSNVPHEPEKRKQQRDRPYGTWERIDLIQRGPFNMIEKLVLVSVAHHEDQREGICFAALSSMAREWSARRDTFRTVFHRLAQSGFVEYASPEQAKRRRLFGRGRPPFTCWLNWKAIGDAAAERPKPRRAHHWKNRNHHEGCGCRACDGLPEGPEAARMAFEHDKRVTNADGEYCPPVGFNAGRILPALAPEFCPPVGLEGKTFKRETSKRKGKTVSRPNAKSAFGPAVATSNSKPAMVPIKDTAKPKAETQPLAVRENQEAVAPTTQAEWVRVVTEIGHMKMISWRRPRTFEELAGERDRQLAAFEVRQKAGKPA